MAVEIFRLFGRVLINDKEAHDSLQKIDNKAQDNVKSFENIVAGAAKIGAAVVAAGTVVVGAIGGMAIKAVDDFTVSINKLQQQTGATAEQTKEYKDIVKDLYNQNYGESFDDIAQSMAEVRKQTNLSGEALKDTTAYALKLKDTMGYEVVESTRSATMLTKIFAVTSKEAYSLIAQGAQEGLDKNGDLLDTINEYSAYFEAAGFSANDMFNMLKNGVEGGAFSVDKLGDAIKEFGIRSKDNSKTSQEAFKTLGMNVDQTTKAFAEGGEAGRKAFDDVRQRIMQMTDPVTQNTVGVALFGTMWEDLGVKGIEALTDIKGGMDASKNAIDQINGTSFQTFGAMIETVKRNIETNFLLPMGEKLLPLLPQIQDAITKVADAVIPKFQEWMGLIGNIVMQLFPDLGKETDGVKDKVNIFKIALDGITAVLRFANDHIGLVKAALIALGVIWVLQTGFVIAHNAALLIDNIQSAIATVNTIALGVALGSHAVVLGIVTAAQWLWNVAMSANPIGLIILAIAALIAIVIAVATHWTEVSNTLLWIWDIIKNAFWAGVNALAGFFKWLGDGISSIFDGIWKGVKAGFVAIVNFLINGLNNLIAATLLPFNLLIKALDLIPGVDIPEINLKIPNLPALATGGVITHEGRVLVGENGPEILDLPQGAKVTPLNRSEDNDNKKVENKTLNFTLTIEKFVNNRKEDFEELMEELQFIIEQKLLGTGGSQA